MNRKLSKKQRQLSIRAKRSAKYLGFVPKPEHEDYIIFCTMAGKE